MEDNFDEYEFKDVTRDTFYAIVDVSRNIKRFVEATLRFARRPNKN